MSEKAYKVLDGVSDLTGIGVSRLYKVLKKKGVDIPAPASANGRFDIGDRKVDESIFETGQDGSNAYSSFLIVEKTEKEVIDTLNLLATRGESWHRMIYCGVRDGKQDNGNVRFSVMKGSPDLVYDLTEELHTIGYSMTDWNGSTFICAENGEDSDDFTAAWDDSSPYYYEDDGGWDAYAIAVDNRSGAKFCFGGGCVDSETKESIERIVLRHTCLNQAGVC